MAEIYFNSFSIKEGETVYINFPDKNKLSEMKYVNSRIDMDDIRLQKTINPYLTFVDCNNEHHTFKQTELCNRVFNNEDCFKRNAPKNAFEDAIKIYLFQIRNVISDKLIDCNIENGMYSVSYYKIYENKITSHSENIKSIVYANNERRCTIVLDVEFENDISKSKTYHSREAAQIHLGYDVENIDGEIKHIESVADRLQITPAQRKLYEKMIDIKEQLEKDGVQLTLLHCGNLDYLIPMNAANVDSINWEGDSTDIWLGDLRFLGRPTKYVQTYDEDGDGGYVFLK